MATASGVPRLRPGTRVRLVPRYNTVYLPLAAISGTGTILEKLSGKVEVYSWEVAVDGIDPGPSGQSNRYTYDEYELEPL